MKKKLTYEIPEVELILARFEENLLASEPTTMNGWTPGDYKTAGDHENFDPGNQYGTL